MERVELKKCPVNGGLISSCLPFKAQWLRRLTDVGEKSYLFIFCLPALINICSALYVRESL